MTHRRPIADVVGHTTSVNIDFQKISSTLASASQVSYYGWPSSETSPHLSSSEIVRNFNLQRTAWSLNAWQTQWVQETSRVGEQGRLEARNRTPRGWHGIDSPTRTFVFLNLGSWSPIALGGDFGGLASNYGCFWTPLYYLVNIAGVPFSKSCFFQAFY